MTSVLCISARNIKLLKPYQKVYLIFSIVLWLIICIFYLLKFVILLYTQISKKYLNHFKLEIKVKRVIGITYGCSYLLILIGFFYDIILLLEEKIGSAIYLIIYFIISFIYFILSIIDFFFIEDTISMINKIALKNSSIMRTKPREDEAENEGINNENKKKSD